MTTKTFRKSFTFANKDVLKWFPGHMATGLKNMQHKLKYVDCIIEVHDARIPISGRNPNFYNLLTAVRPLVLALNKEDLIESKQKAAITNVLEKSKNVNKVIFTNCKLDHNAGIRKIVPTVLDLIQNSNRYNRKHSEDYLLMIIGVPNVGKSSLINQLRARHLKKPKATDVGAQPGVTRSVLERIKINEKPLIYLLDTPGILAPNVSDIETGLKLALCGVLKDYLVGEDIIADYLLYCLNKRQNFSYVDYLGLQEPCDDIQKVLLVTAINLQKQIRLRLSDGTVKWRPNFNAAAAHMLMGFRNGCFGRLNLDEDLLNDMAQRHKLAT